MKKIFVAVAALATMLFVSCNKEANYPSLIQGTWEVKSASSAITKNGQAANVDTFINDMIGVAGQELPEDFKEYLNMMFKELSNPIELPGGATLTFKDGKVSATDTDGIPGMSNGSYTLNGCTLTISANGQSVPFTVNTLTTTDLVLSMDASKLSGQENEGTVNFSINCTINP